MIKKKNPPLVLVSHSENGCLPLLRHYVGPAPWALSPFRSHPPPPPPVPLPQPFWPTCCSFNLPLPDTISESLPLVFPLPGILPPYILMVCAQSFKSVSYVPILMRSSLATILKTGPLQCITSTPSFFCFFSAFKAF